MPVDYRVAMSNMNRTSNVLFESSRGGPHGETKLMGLRLSCYKFYIFLAKCYIELTL